MFGVDLWPSVFEKPDIKVSCGIVINIVIMDIKGVHILLLLSGRSWFNHVHQNDQEYSGILFLLF